MGRRPTGGHVLERALKDVSDAKTVEQLRTAQAVVLPLAFGLSLEQTAQVVGRSAAWVARERQRYIKGETLFSLPAGRGGRRNQLLSEEEELVIVKRGIMLGAYSWEAGAPRRAIRKLLEERIGRPIAESTFNSILSRVARKTIPGGVPGDLTQFNQMLTERWLRERVLAQEKKRKKLQS